MEIQILEGNVNLYKEAVDSYVAAFGKIKENSLAKIKLKVNGTESSNLLSTCGCSVVSSEEKNIFTLQYNDTNIVAPFSKVFILPYREDNKNKQAQIKITGNIIK